MQSYASPGRVITVTNSGPDAVAVRRDQPYRLGLLVGVTQASAEVDAELNLCVEGVYEQTVALADGVAAAEAGDPVLMNVTTFTLVAGLADTTDHVHFGVLAERMTRRRVVLVKLTPASAAAPASGGGDGGNGGGAGGAGAVTILDVTSPGTNQIGFLGVHSVDAGNTSQRDKAGAIPFNRHLYSSAEPLAAIEDGAWISIQQDGFYQVDLRLFVLDQNLDNTSAGFILEELQIDGEAPDRGNQVQGIPPIVSGGATSRGLDDYLQGCADGGQGTRQAVDRADAVFVNGQHAPYTNRRITFTWRVWLQAGKRLRIFGRLHTADFYRDVQLAYGGVTSSNPADGTPELRFSHPVNPSLSLTRIA